MSVTPHSNRQLNDNPPYDDQLKVGLNVFSGTRCGWYHKKNEDYILYDLKNGFFGLSDGVGGGQLGDVASETLLKFLHNQHQTLPSAKQIVHDLEASDEFVQNVLAGYNARGAATVVLAWLDENAKGFISSVGDARIYLLDIIECSDVHQSRVSLTQLTIDQTYENLSVPVPQNRHPDDPIRMIGIGAVGDPPVKEVQLQHNQALFLCSDGIHKFLTTEQMEEICKKYLINRPDDLPLQSIANALIKEAVNNESHDDCSVIIALNYRPNDAKLVYANNINDVSDNQDLLSVVDKTQGNFDNLQKNIEEQPEVSQIYPETNIDTTSDVAMTKGDFQPSIKPSVIASDADKKKDRLIYLMVMIVSLMTLIVSTMHFLLCTNMAK